MKTIFYLVPIAFLLTCCGNFTKSPKNQDANYRPNNKIDKIQFKDILTRLIKSDQIDSLGYSLWIPDKKNVDNFPISEDGFCHTNIDTIMYFQNNDKVDNAIVVLRTFQFDKEGRKFGSHYEGSPVGVGIFKFMNGTWQLDIFKSKLISLGYYVGAEPKYKGTVCLEKLPSGLMCLYCRQNEVCQMNLCQGFECAYSLEDKLDNGVELQKLTEVYYNNFPITSIQSSILK